MSNRDQALGPFVEAPTTGFYPRTCAGCGQAFTTDTYRKTRCRKNCGRTGKNSARAAASAARRAGYVPSYGAMHQRLRTSRGPARAHLCAHQCGAAAVDWAYDHADPDEKLVEGRRHGIVVVVAYSLDLGHYLPLCRSCHAIFDEGRGMVARMIRAGIGQSEPVESIPGVE